MIQISKSATADTRSAEDLVTKEQLLLSSAQHINDVSKALHWMAFVLMTIAEKHDYTKVKNIDEFYSDFNAIQEGRLNDFKNMHWYKDLHLQERHHIPDRCPDDVTLFDLLERIADCVMAGMARTGKVFDDEIEPEILSKAYKNTYDLLKSQVVIQEADHGAGGEGNE